MNNPVGQLKIGPVRFVLHGEGASPVRYDEWAYRDFFGPAEDASGLAEDTMVVRLTQGTPACPDGSPLFKAGGNWAVWNVADGWVFCCGMGRGAPRSACHVERTLRQATLVVDGGPEDAPLRYPLDQVLSYGLLAKCGGILMHAAAVEYNGVGLVFAGRSGAGKSTLSGLCHQQGWNILNDDRVMLYPDPTGEGWLVAGTPWHGSGRFARNQKLPLKGVCVLQQDTRNWVEPLSPREARYALLDVAGIAWFEETWSQQALDALGRLTGEVSVVRYHFTRSEQAVDALQALL